MPESVLETSVVSGSCHCESLRVAWHTARGPGEFAPRACDCSFCSKHGAAWVSDNAAHAVVTCEIHGDLVRYRQGAELADFLLCARCGVVVAVVFTEGEHVLGAINAGCLDAAVKLAPRVSASPQQLDAESRLERWRKVWMPVRFGLGSRSDR